MKRIPKSLVERAREDIEKARVLFEERKAVRSIPNETVDYLGIFTDGSNVLSERRGCGIALFSTVSILYNKNNPNKKVVRSFIINPEDTLFIVLPKFNLASRINTIMRGFEYISAMSILNDDVDLVVFDGSYVTSMIEPRAVSREYFSDIVRVASKLAPTKHQEIIFEMIERLDGTISSELDKIFKDVGDVGGVYKKFIREYYNIYGETYNTVKDLLKLPLEVLKSTIQNYIFALIEQNFAVKALSLVMKKAANLNIPVVWVSKDSESRLLTKILSSIALSNDLSLLDFILEDNQYVSASSLSELSEIEPERMTIRKMDEIVKTGKTYGVLRDLAENFYRDFAEYDVTYAKMGGPVLQLTYPKKLVDSKKLGVVLSYLRSISIMGYPEPLIFVHNRTVLRERVIKILSESIYQICSKRETYFLCNLLQKSGRESFL